MAERRPVGAGVNPACACGSPRTVRHGSDAATHLRLADGRAERVAGVTPRFLCKGCGKTFTHRPPEVEAEERAVRDRAAELAFALGRAPAARELGIGPSAIATMLDRWHRARDIDTHGAEPDFLAIECATLRGAGAILVADVDREALVEVVPDTDRLAEWLTRPGRLPALRVCVPLDAGLAVAVRKALPEAIAMVAPATVVRAIRGALAGGLRILRRMPGMRARNGFPSTARFLRCVEVDRPGEGWPREVLALHGAGRLANEIVQAPDAAKACALWPEFGLAASVPGGQPLVRLMATWRTEILAGLDHRFVDRVAKTMHRIRRLAQARRPSLVFQDFRGLVLLRDYGQACSKDPGGPGRPLAGIADLLRGAAPA
jgi:transposase-like protein